MWVRRLLCRFVIWAKGFWYFLFWFPLQVDNAAKKGASAVLIYPDDDTYRSETVLYGHVSLQPVITQNKPSNQVKCWFVMAVDSFIPEIYCFHALSGPSGLRWPLHPWIPFLQPHPVSPDSVVRPPQNPRSDPHPQRGFETYTVRPNTAVQMQATFFRLGNLQCQQVFYSCWIQ